MSTDVKHQPRLQAPNVPGVLLGLIQVGLHCIYGSPSSGPKQPPSRRNSICTRANLKSEKVLLLSPDLEEQQAAGSPRMHTPLLGGLERVNSGIQETGDSERTGILLSVVADESNLDSPTHRKRVSHISPADGQYPLLEASSSTWEATRGVRRASLGQQYPVMESAQLLPQEANEELTRGQAGHVAHHRRPSVGLQYPVMESAHQMVGGGVSRRQSRRLPEEEDGFVILPRSANGTERSTTPRGSHTPLANGAQQLSWEGLLQSSGMMDDAEAGGKRNS